VGRPVTSVQGLYERMTLEAFQSRLSWITVLGKRENFRRAFAGFDPGRVAAFTEDDVARLLCDPGIIRNRAKITAAIENARLVVDLGPKFQSWCSAIGWSAARGRAQGSGAPSHRSQSLWREPLKARGFRFFGPTTAYAMMQA
jgi:DNA-3-methyladenine glycosylase I